MAADLSRIDHIILGVNDLQKGIEQFERLTGVRAVYGGAHPALGTHNALASLGELRYLEILAPNPEADGTSDWAGDLKDLTSLTPVGWAAKGENLPALEQSLKDQGIETGDIQPGARDKPDGTRLAWKTLGFAPSSHSLLSLLHPMGPRHRAPVDDLARRLPSDGLHPRGPHPGRPAETFAGGRCSGGSPRGEGIWYSDLPRLSQRERRISVDYGRTTMSPLPSSTSAKEYEGIG